MKLSTVLDVGGIAAVAASLYATLGASSSSYIDSIVWVNVEYLILCIALLVCGNNKSLSRALLTWSSSLLVQFLIAFLGIVGVRSSPAIVIVVTVIQLALLIIRIFVFPSEPLDDGINPDNDEKENRRTKRIGVPYLYCFLMSVLALSVYFFTVFALHSSNLIDVSNNAFLSQFLEEGMIWFGFYCRCLVEMVVASYFACRVVRLRPEMRSPEGQFKRRVKKMRTKKSREEQADDQH